MENTEENYARSSHSPLAAVSNDHFLTSDQSYSDEYLYIDLYCDTDSESYEDDTEKEQKERIDHPVPDHVSWTDDFTTFRGTREEFHEVSGPKIEGTSPSGLFTQIWDRSIVEQIVKETNNYAWEKIAQASETGISPQSKLNDWVETSVSEMYQLIALLMFMDLCVISDFAHYWSTDGIPRVRKIMSKDRFMLLMRFLHFTDNNTLLSQGYDRKIEKIQPIVDYLNTKFKAAYTPCQELCVNETTLIWKGPLKLQSIRTKSIRIGVKNFELCEASSGYVLTTILYSGNCSTTPEPSLGFKSLYTQMAVQLMGEYLGKGYTIFLDKFYNSLPLSRYLKERGTDVVGVLNRRRPGAPFDIKNVKERSIPKETVISRHCGDISIVAWKNWSLVTTISTYHNADMAPVGRPGKTVMKPVVLNDYKRFKGHAGVTEEEYSNNIVAREQGLKWYQKVFRRLLKTSVQNAFLIYCSNIGGRKRMSHDKFCFQLIEELLDQFIVDSSLDVDISHPHLSEQNGTTFGKEEANCK